MDRRAELGAFLRSRRARLTPEDVGLPRYEVRRRVPGLRREELAQLAGLSVDYYTRFEQGRAENASNAVIDAVARSLRLSESEHVHLLNLAHPALVRATPQQVRPGLRTLLDSMTDLPAFVVGRRTDVLAWNRMYAELIIDFDALPPERRNKAWLVFLEPSLRQRYVNWESKARDIIAFLRMDLGRHPADPATYSLINELSAGSPEFQQLWDAQEVREKHYGTYQLRHPIVGELAVQAETLVLPGDPDQALITWTAEPGSPSEAALRALADLVDRTKQTTLR